MWHDSCISATKMQRQIKVEKERGPGVNHGAYHMPTLPLPISLTFLYWSDPLLSALLNSSKKKKKYKNKIKIKIFFWFILFKNGWITNSAALTGCWEAVPDSGIKLLCLLQSNVFPFKNNSTLFIVFPFASFLCVSQMCPLSAGVGVDSFLLHHLTMGCSCNKTSKNILICLWKSQEEWLSQREVCPLLVIPLLGMHYCSIYSDI